MGEGPPARTAPEERIDLLGVPLPRRAQARLLLTAVHRPRAPVVDHRGEAAAVDLHALLPQRAAAPGDIDDLPHAAVGEGQLDGRVLQALAAGADAAGVHRLERRVLRQVGDEVQEVTALADDPAPAYLGVQVPVARGQGARVHAADDGARAPSGEGGTDGLRHGREPPVEAHHQEARRGGSAASTSRSCVSFRASGFSTKTCLPARRARATSVACVSCRVAMQTSDTAGSAKTSSGSVPISWKPKRARASCAVRPCAVTTRRSVDAARRLEPREQHAAREGSRAHEANPHLAPLGRGLPAAPQGAGLATVALRVAHHDAQRAAARCPAISAS